MRQVEGNILMRERGGEVGRKRKKRQGRERRKFFLALGISPLLDGSKSR